MPIKASESGPIFMEQGRTTLVAGSATVVPQYLRPNDPTVVILVTRNTPGGSIGNLSVLDADRTNTDFDISSDDAGETSSVDWVMIRAVPT